MPDITINVNAKDKATPELKKVEGSFESLADKAQGALAKVNQDGAKTLGSIATSLRAVGGAVLDAAKGAVGGVGSVLSGLSSGVGAVFDGIVALAKGAVGAVVAIFEGMGQAIGLVFNKVTAIAAAAFTFVVAKLGQAGAAAEALERGLDRLAKRSKTSADAIVAAITKGAGGTVSKLDAMRLANEALLDGTVDTAEEFRQLAELADFLADTIGGDTTEAFRRLLLGIRGGNDRMLESIGINVEAKAAYEAVARQLGKEVTALTERERAQALLNAVLRETRDLVRGAATDTDLLGDKFDRIQVAIANAFTSAGEVVTPALGKIADALQPIIERTQAWIAANQEAATGRLLEWAGSLATGIERVAAKLPEIVSLVREGLGAAFAFVGKVAGYVWVGITDGIAGVQREFEVFRDALKDFFAGKGFKPEDSALLAGFRVIKAQVKVLALEAAAAFSESFGGMAADVANVVRKVQNQIIELQAGNMALRNMRLDATDAITRPFDDPLDPGSERARNKAARDRELRELLERRRLSPVTAGEVSSDLRRSQAGANAELEAALADLSRIGSDIDTRGQGVRESASAKLDEFTGALGRYFEADERLVEKQATAYEESQAEVMSAIDSLAELARINIQTSEATTREARRQKSQLDEMIRHARANGWELPHVPVVVTGN